MARMLRPQTAQQRCAKDVLHTILLIERSARVARISVTVSAGVVVPDKRYDRRRFSKP